MKTINTNFYENESMFFYLNDELEEIRRLVSKKLSKMVDSAEKRKIVANLEENKCNIGFVLINTLL